MSATFAAPARAVAPPAEAITPRLVEAAKNEGKIVLRAEPVAAHGVVTA